MKLSQYFLPIKKDIKDEKTVLSHKLMIKSGMIKQISSGLYSWLPLGLKVLRKIEDIIREEFLKAGILEVLMPTIQPAELWKESGRYDGYGKEMLRIKDRHNNDFLYGPTAEEVIVYIAKNEIKSYKDLPKSLYNIQWKFRDEIRPRFGVMRCREFLMMDSYSFDIDESSAIASYNKHYDVLLKIFSKMGLVAIPTKADTGEIGGDLSHEFNILAESGESSVFYDKKLDDVINKIKNGENIDNIREEISKYYAASDEKHNENTCEVKKEDLKERKAIEVGHIFYFSDKYTKSMNMQIQLNNGQMINPVMGSYGIGVGRLVAAFIEANNDEKGIVWHKSISPFDIGLINLMPKNEESTKYADEIYLKLKSSNIDVLYDDTQNSVGQKFANMELIGLPQYIVISPKLLENEICEVVNRKTEKKTQVMLNEIIEYCIKNL